MIAIDMDTKFILVEEDSVKGCRLCRTESQFHSNGVIYDLYKPFDAAAKKAIEAALNPKKKYNVTITRYGFAEIEASSEDEAMEIANSMSADDFSWSDDWEATDAVDTKEE